MKSLGACFVLMAGFLRSFAVRRSARFAGNPWMLVCLLGLTLCLGCLTTAASNEIWNSREGNYTVNQAVMDLGRPTKAAKLSDGSQVASWMIRPGTRGNVTRGLVPIYTSHTIDYSLYSNAPYQPDEYIRLLFGPDGKLITWERQYK